MANKAADLVFRNGLIVTPGGTIEGGVAILDGKIAAVGNGAFLPAADRQIDLGSVFPIGTPVSAGTQSVSQNGARVDVMWCLDDNVLVADPNGGVGGQAALSVVNDRAQNFINGIHNGHEISHLGSVVTGSYVNAAVAAANTGTKAGTADR